MRTMYDVGLEINLSRIKWGFVPTMFASRFYLALLLAGQNLRLALRVGERCHVRAACVDMLECRQ